jgi:hypothetical protein
MVPLGYWHGRGEGYYQRRFRHGRDRNRQGDPRRIRGGARRLREYKGSSNGGFLFPASGVASGSTIDPNKWASDLDATDYLYWNGSGGFTFAFGGVDKLTVTEAGDMSAVGWSDGTQRWYTGRSGNEIRMYTSQTDQYWVLRTASVTSGPILELNNNGSWRTRFNFNGKIELSPDGTDYGNNINTTSSGIAVNSNNNVYVTSGSAKFVQMNTKHVNLGTPGDNVAMADGDMVNDSIALYVDGSGNLIAKYKNGGGTTSTTTIGTGLTA